MAPFIDFILSFRFLQFYEVKCLNFCEYLKSRDIPNDVTKWVFCAIFNTFAENETFSYGFQLSK